MTGTKKNKDVEKGVGEPLPAIESLYFKGDKRYPAPTVFPVPEIIKGIPTQEDLDAHPRLFTWGELKEIIRSHDLNRMTRSKAIQGEYESWFKKEKKKWGSGSDYVTKARLPWGEANKGDGREKKGAVDEEEGEEGGDDKKGEGKGDDKAEKGKKGKQDGKDKKDEKSAKKEKEEDKDDKKENDEKSAKKDEKSAKKEKKEVKEKNDDKDDKEDKGAKDDDKKDKNDDKDKKDNKDDKDDGSDEADEDTKGDAKDSMAYVAIEDVKKRLQDAKDNPDDDQYLRLDPEAGLDEGKYAVLLNDWPYCLPYGVRHFCIWSRVPIAHPVLVDYDEKQWRKIEERGLSGFTGVIPLIAEEHDSDDEEGAGANGALAAENDEDAQDNQADQDDESDQEADAPVPELGLKGGVAPSRKGRGGWYAVDMMYAGAEMREWGGVEFECKGGQEVGNMVRGLWDPRGWETIWFVNPPRLQSIPGYAHFHIFARRKTPDEIDISEQAYDAKYKDGKREPEEETTDDKYDRKKNIKKGGGKSGKTVDAGESNPDKTGRHFDKTAKGKPEGMGKVGSKSDRSHDRHDEALGGMDKSKDSKNKSHRGAN